MLTVLSGLADVERDLIRTRTAEGRSRAKARGQRMRRPPALTQQQQAEARQRRAEGATLKELAASWTPPKTSMKPAFILIHCCVSQEECEHRRSGTGVL